MREEDIAKMIQEADVKNPAVWNAIVKKVGELRIFLIGLVVLVGSMGLIMGAVTCAIASAAIAWCDFDLVPAMLTGFFSAAVVSLAGGVLLVRAGIPR